MSTLPGVPVIAQNYHDYMVLLTVGDEVSAVVDGAPPGPNGRCFTVEPNKAVKVPYEAGRFLLNHYAYTGVVRVKEVENADGSGTTRDIETAKTESALLLEQEDARRWRDYITYVIEDKLNNKKVVPPPPEAIKRIMDRRGYKLEDFGINVLGQAGEKSSGAEVAALKAANADLSDKLSKLTDLLTSQASRTAELEAKLNEALGEPEPEKKGKGK